MDNEKIESESQSGRGGGSLIVAKLDSSAGQHGHGRNREYACARHPND